MNKIYRIGKCILLFGLLFLAQQSLYSAPTQLSPQNGDDCVDTDATFEWTKVQNASYYMYLISTQSDFSDTVKKDLHYADTIVSYQLPDNSTTYYWKVGSSIIGQPDDWSDGFELTTKAAAPTQIAPADLAVCQDFSQDFTWNKIPSATSYRLMISATSNFGDVRFDTLITDTTINLVMTDYFQNYYWRVSGTNGSCSSEWSAVHQFRTVVGPPSVTFPADSADGVDLAITFSWPVAGGAESYDLQVATDPGFTDLVVDETGLIETTFDYTASGYNTQLWWRLRTLGQGCNSVWSKAYTFSTAYPQAVAVSPNDSARCVPLLTTFTWNAIASASQYEVQASKTELFTTQDILFEQKGITDTTVTGDVKNASSRIYWRVRANDSLNTGLWSEVKSYFTTGDAPLSLAPTDGAVEVPRGVQIQWQSIGQAQSFELQIARDAAFTDIALEHTGIADLKKDVVLPEYNTKYYYRVRASFNGCLSGWSQVFSFTSIQGFPNLIYPADNDVNITTEVQLEWSNVPTAQNYDFRIATDSLFVDYAGQNGVQSNSYLFKGLKPQTLYYWKVRSNDQWGTSPWSEVFTFTTGDGFTDIPTIILPESNSVKVAVQDTVTWTPSANASTYHIQFSKDRKFETIALEDSTITSTQYIFTGLDNFTEYWVRVAAVNPTTTSDYSVAHKFRTIALAPSEKGVATAPADGATKVPYDKVNFTWSHVARTDIGLASESGYEFLLSKSDDFADTVVYNQRVFEDGLLVRDIFDYSTTYFWKIRGWNEAGFGPWSDTYSFTTDSKTSVESANYFDFGASIVPNPAESNAELHFTTEKPSTATLTIVDQTGKVLFHLDNLQTKSNENVVPLNFTNFSNGSYLFKLRVGNKVQTGKIIISR